MKKTIYSTLSVMVLVLAGCSGPELAQSQYGPVEKKWEKYLKSSYPAWSPPKTMPPASSEPVTEVIEIQEEEIVATEEPVVETVETAVEPVIDTDIVEINPQPATPAGDAEKYTVQKGDTLWKIAKKFYQKGSKWPVILEANKDVINNPKNIKPGMELKIPAP